MSFSPTWEEAREQVLDQAFHTCEFCRAPAEEFDRGLDVHHIWPRQDGGSDKPHNLVALCRSCHQSIESWTRTLLRHPTPDNPKARVRHRVAVERDRELPGATRRRMITMVRLREARKEE